MFVGIIAAVIVFIFGGLWVVFSKDKRDGK